MKKVHIRMTHKIMSFVVCMIMMLSMLNISASASTTYGYGFASKPITIYATSNLNSTEVSQLKEAIAVWNSTRVGTVLVYGGQKNLSTMFWLSDGQNGVIKTAIADNNTGVTSTKYNGTNIIEADIAINSNLTYNNGSTTGGTYYLKSVFVHELGHFLGLDDNFDSSSVMYFSYTGRTALSASDINDLDSLY